MKKLLVLLVIVGLVTSAFAVQKGNYNCAFVEFTMGNKIIKLKKKDWQYAELSRIDNYVFDGSKKYYFDGSIKINGKYYNKFKNNNLIIMFPIKNEKGIFKVVMINLKDNLEIGGYCMKK